MDTIETLPHDLQEAVAMDNKMFAQEIEDWDNEQARKSMSDPEVTVTYEHRPSTFVRFWSMVPWADQIQHVSCRSAVRARVHPEVTLCNRRVLKFQELASCARGPCRSVQFSSGQCCWYLSCVADQMLKSSC